MAFHRPIMKQAASRFGFAGAAMLLASLAVSPASAQNTDPEPAPADPTVPDAAADSATADAYEAADSAGDPTAETAAAKPQKRRTQILVAASPGSGINRFHLVKQSSCQHADRWRNVGGCVKWLAKTRAFGPKPVNARYRLRRASTYYLVPVCAGFLDWRFHALANDSIEDARVELRCTR